MLSLHKLEVFLAVAQEGKISRAAERLFMTQAAVSQHIHDLEAALGVTLFSRHPQGVSLTRAGEILLRYARDIVWTVSAAENALSDVKNLKDGKLMLGATPTAASMVLPDWLSSFHEQYPFIKVIVQTNTTPILEQSLLEKRIDIAFLEGEIQDTKRLRAAELLKTSIVAVVSASHPWASLDSISIQELAKAPYLSRQGKSHTRIWEMELFARFGLQPNIVAEFDNPYAIQRAIIQGLGVSLMPACFVREEETQGRLRLLPVREIPELHRSLKAAWLGDLPLGPIPNAFLRFLMQRYPHLQILAAP